MIDRRTAILGIGAAVAGSRLSAAQTPPGERKPFFRFHPHAYEDGALRRSLDPCEVCQRPCQWQHAGPIYTKREIGSVCASCIADGRLREARPDMQLQDVRFSRGAPALQQEILARTPGVPSFNPFDWPVMAGTPMVFIGEGEHVRFRGNAAALRAVSAGWRTMEGEGEAPLRYALLFRQLQGSALKAIFDFD